MPLTDVKFVTSGAWGSGVSRPLTAPEVDLNFHSIKAAIDDLIANPVEGVSLTNIVQSGTSLTFYLSDGSTRGPFALPVAYPRYRGAWIASASYAVNDIVYAAGYGTYLVVLDHTADLVFDPNEASSAGEYYIQIAGDPNLSTQVLTVSASTLTLSAAHIGKYLRCTNGSGCVITVPEGVLYANAEVHFRQATTGPISLVPASSGVSVVPPSGYDYGSALLGATFTLKCVETNLFDLFGNLAMVSA